MKKVNEYKVSIKTLEKKVGDKELLTSVALREVRRLQMESPKAKTEKKLLTNTTKEWLRKTDVASKLAGMTSHELAQIVDLKHVGLVMEMGREISGRPSNEMSELEVGFQHLQRKWRRIGEEYEEHSAVNTITGGWYHIYVEH